MLSEQKAAVETNEIGLQPQCGGEPKFDGGRKSPDSDGHMAIQEGSSDDTGRRTRPASFGTPKKQRRKGRRRRHRRLCSPHARLRHTPPADNFHRELHFEQGSSWKGKFSGTGPFGGASLTSSLNSSAGATDQMQGFNVTMGFDPNAKGSGFNTTMGNTESSCVTNMKGFDTSGGIGLAA